MLTLRTLTPDDWQLWRGLRLEALREAPYAFGSKLADWQDSGDTEERWRHRLASVPYNLIAYSENHPAGMASGTVADDEPRAAELISLWVAPFARGCGVGDSLVHSVLKWARQGGYAKILLAVDAANHFAVALYQRHGFVHMRDSLDAVTGRAERVMSLAL
jgi:ribosomal protein S18 acetylase RimI-like enzyme